MCLQYCNNYKCFSHIRVNKCPCDNYPRDRILRYCGIHKPIVDTRPAGSYDNSKDQVKQQDHEGTTYQQRE
jgi:hypothetical protein